MADIAGASQSLVLPVRRVDVEAPWRWLTAGWRDLRRVPAVSLSYGAAFVVISFLLTWGLWLFGLFYLVLPLAAGFMLVGPVIAVGLYEVSRRLEQGQRVTLAVSLAAWSSHRGPIATMGLVVTLVLLAWIWLAFLIFALFFGPAPPSWEHLVTTLLFSIDGIPFLIVGIAVGGALAAFVFAMTAVALPALLDRDIGVLGAILTSFAAVLRNWRVMIGWGALIAVFTGAGLVTFYLGLAVTLPLVGHASWHAYRDLVAPDSH
ncbi:MAG TPA: DUF2189 domain-containing protein [Candidatus Acidoferrum sp.]|nr:DUF2189 domain-containing protein [Candidatus Acidoferrum sp.]